MKENIFENLKTFLRVKNYSNHTISNYERDVKRFLAFASKTKISIKSLEQQLSLIHISEPTRPY